MAFRQVPGVKHLARSAPAESGGYRTCRAAPSYHVATCSRTCCPSSVSMTAMRAGSRASEKSGMGGVVRLRRQRICLQRLPQLSREFLRLFGAVVRSVPCQEPRCR
jgi:hypothetical protein